jgi:branched-chain amino acid transport system substrate-binding protein
MGGAGHGAVTRQMEGATTMMYLYRMISRNLALGLGLAALVAAAPAAAQELVIGVVNPMTGPGSDLGISGQQAVDPMVAEINKAGGVNGMKLRVIYRDDQSNPQRGVAAALELIQREKVDLIMGANLTNVAFAVSPAINQAKIPFIVFGTGDGLTDPAKFPYSFRLNMTNAMEAAAISEYVAKTLKLKAPGLLVDNTALGQSGERALRAALEKHGIQPVARETFALADTDMSGQIINIKNAKADVILVWGLGPMLAQAARSAERVGFSVPVIGGVGTHQEGFYKLAGPAGEKWSATFFRSFTSTENGQSPENVKAFIAKLRGIYGDKLSSSNMISGVWDDSLRFVLHAVAKAKSKDGDAIKAAIESTAEFKGMMSTYSFSPTKHDGFDPKDVTIAYSMGAVDFIRKRVPNAP